MSVLKVIRNSLVYSVVSVLQKAISFLLLPLYTFYLSTHDIGIVAVVTSITNILSILFGLSLNASANRFYYEFKNEEQVVRKVFGTIFLFVIFNSIVLSGILIIFNNTLLAPFSKGIEFYPFLLLGILISFFSSIYTMFQYILQAKQEGKLYGINNISFFLINVVSTIVFMVFFKMKATAVLLSLAATNFVFFLYTLYKFVPQIQLSINKYYLKLTLKYALPLVPHSLASWLMVMVNSIIINNYMGTSSVGIYSVGFQLGNILNLLTGAVNQAFVPWFFENYKVGEKNKIIRFAEVLVLLFCVIAMFLSLFAKEIVQIMVTKSFDDAWLVVLPIAFTYVFSGLYYFFSAPLFYNTKTVKYIPLITISSAIVNVVLNILFIPHLGIMGAALASFIAVLVSAIIAQLLSYKYEWISYKWQKMYFFVFLATTISLLSYLPISGLILLGLKTFILLMIMMIIYFRYKVQVKEAYHFIVHKTNKDAL